MVGPEQCARHAVAASKVVGVALVSGVLVTCPQGDQGRTGFPPMNLWGGAGQAFAGAQVAAKSAAIPPHPTEPPSALTGPVHP